MLPEQPLPESDEYSINSRTAFEYLIKYLPEHWKCEPSRDYLSGNEYGQDWHVLMTNSNNQINGQEFRIQSKVIESKRRLTSRRVGAKMNVSTLISLRRVPVPVMLHFIDKNAKLSYWMWLDDWYDENDISSVEHKKEVIVYISRKNIFDEHTADAIQKYIALWHIRATLLKQAIAASIRDPHYEYRTSFSLDDISIEIYAKHKDAPPINFSILQAAIDTDALKRLEERGESFSFRGLLHLDTKLPQFVTPPDLEMELTLFNPVPDLRFPASIEFSSTNPEYNYKIHYVQFRLDRDGTKYRKFVGEALGGHLICTLEVDIPNHKISLGISHNPNNQSIRSFKTFFEFRQYSSTFNRMHLTSLEPLGNAYGDVPEDMFPEFSADEKMGYRLVKALTLIEDSAKVKFELPKTAASQVVNVAETIAEIVSIGYTSRPMSEVNSYGNDRVLIVTTDVATAEKMKSDLQENETIPCWYKLLEPTTAKVLKRKINLGMGAYIFRVKKILDFKSLPPEVTEGNNDDRISFPVEVDWAATITTFKDWLPDDNQMGVDWERPMD